jgi:hypothetical protein
MALLVGAGACCRPRATPPPGFAGPVDAVPRDTALAYASSLVYDSSYMAGDAQYLLQRDSATGPVTALRYAKIQPEIGAAAIDSAGLVRGRFLARLKLDSAYVLRLPVGPGHDTTFTLPDSVSYLWVSGSPGHAHMVLVPATASDSAVRLPCHFYPAYDSGGWQKTRLAVARFKVAPPLGFDDSFCFPCNSGWCCAEM